MAVEQLPATEPPVAHHSLQNIVQRIDLKRQCMRSLFADYIVTDLNSEGPRAVAESSRHLIAARGPMRFAENIHRTPHGGSQLDLNHFFSYYTGRSLDLFYVQQRFYEKSEELAETNFSWKLRGAFPLECLGWWPPDDDTESPPIHGRPFFLHEALILPEYKLKSHQEMVEGVWCHVIERPGADKLWFDLAMDCALRRREIYSDDSGDLAICYELNEYRNAGDNIYLPFSLRRVVYDGRDRGESKQAKVLLAAHCRILDMQVNQVSDEMFRFVPPPGTLVKNADSGETSQLPGGLDFLDQVIETARQLMIVNGQITPATSRSESQLVAVMLVVLLIVLFAYGLVRFSICGRYHRWKGQLVRAVCSVFHS